METVEVIYRQDALEALRTCYETERIDYTNGNEYINYDQAVHEVEQLPAAQPEQTKMIKEIRKWINSGNRGSADYFIVDKIEEIINRYE